MCNDYAREIELGRVMKAVEEMKNTPPISWLGGKVPNDIAPRAHIKISDNGFIARWDGSDLSGSMIKWAWKTPRGKPVFNFVSEKRDFSKTERCLILATGFYEYTEPEKLKIKLKDQHFFTMKGEEWFWIAGIVKDSAFAMLTTEPGPDMQPYHDRQICVLPPDAGMHWLRLDQPTETILTAPPRGTLKVKTLRRDGVEA